MISGITLFGIINPQNKNQIQKPFSPEPTGPRQPCSGNTRAMDLGEDELPAPAGQEGDTGDPRTKGDAARSKAHA